MNNYHIVETSTLDGGKVGGLILLWNDDVNLTINVSNTNKIDCEFFSVIRNDICRTCIYVYSNANNKHITYYILSNLNKITNLDDWIVCWDFNMAMSPLEKQGEILLNTTLLTCSKIPLMILILMV